MTSSAARFPRMTLIYLFLGLYGLTVIYPVALMIVSSFKGSREIFTSPFALPQSWSPVNYIEAWTQGNFSELFSQQHRGHKRFGRVGAHTR